MNPLLASLAGRLIVSCQAYPGEPLRTQHVMPLMAAAAVAGGASAVRVQGTQDIADTREVVDVPIIGLWKDGDDDVFITPTLQHARAVRDAGAHVVALDGTRRPRPDGLTLAKTLRRLRAEGTLLVMADCGSLDDALAARDAGADIIGTTLSGYTPDRTPTDGPDLDLVAQLATAVPDLPVIAEGRIHTPHHARQAIESGAYAVVVGTAITHPTTITSWFAQSVTGSMPR